MLGLAARGHGALGSRHSAQHTHRITCMRSGHVYACAVLNAIAAEQVMDSVLLPARFQSQQ